MRNLGKNKYPWAVKSKSNVDTSDTQSSENKGSNANIEVKSNKPANLATMEEQTTQETTLKSNKENKETESTEEMCAHSEDLTLKVSLDVENQQSIDSVITFLEKISNNNHHLLAAAELLRCHPHTWGGVSYKLDKEILCNRMILSDYSFESLVNKFSYETLKEFQNTIPPILKEKEAEYFESKLKQREEAIKNALSNLSVLNLPKSKMTEIREHIYKEFNEQIQKDFNLPEKKKGLRTQKGVKKSKNLQAPEDNLQCRSDKKIARLTLEPVVGSTKPSYAKHRENETKGLCPANYKVKVDGMELYFSGLTNNSLLRKYIELVEEKSVEVFKNKDNIPPYFHSSFQSQNMRKRGITSKMKALIEEAKASKE